MRASDLRQQVESPIPERPDRRRRVFPKERHRWKFRQRAFPRVLEASSESTLPPQELSVAGKESLVPTNPSRIAPEATAERAEQTIRCCVKEVQRVLCQSGLKD